MDMDTAVDMDIVLEFGQMALACEVAVGPMDKVAVEQEGKVDFVGMEDTMNVVDVVTAFEPVLRVVLSPS